MLEGCAAGIPIQQVIHWSGSTWQGHRAELCIDDDKAEIFLANHTIKGLSSNDMLHILHSEED